MPERKERTLPCGNPGSRRRFLFEGACVLGAFAAISAAGCAKELRCTDTSSLSEEERNRRQGAEYVDNSVLEGKRCTTCQQFQVGAKDACGSCRVVPGPVNPGGYCKLWVKKTG